MGLFKWKRRRKAEAKEQEKYPAEWIRYPHLPPIEEGARGKHEMTKHEMTRIKIIVFELDQPTSIDQLQRLAESICKLGVKTILLGPDVKMKILKPENTEKEEDREDMVLVERDEWERLKGIEEGLKAMIQRMGAEATSAAINSVAKYGKLYKELAKK